MNSLDSKILEIRRKLIEKDFSKMNPAQKKAVFKTQGPLLILAGAGTGKTTVLVNRVANIILYGDAYLSEVIPSFIDEDIITEVENSLALNREVDVALKRKFAINAPEPWQILAITFTNKAAGELKNRLSLVLGDKADEIWASTFHSTCARILRRHGDRLGYTNHFTIYDTDDSKRVIKDCQKHFNIDEKILPCKAIISEISKAKDNLLNCDEYLSQAGNDFRLSEIAKVYNLYQKKLKDADAMDFDDLLMNTVLLLKKFPDILEYYQNRFRYIMVDEYQDTNHVQYILIKMLADKYGNLCVVGDDDQSIYKFRGATIRNILDFEDTYPDAGVIRLEQNYRSTQNILSAANAVISNNEDRKGKELWTKNGEGEKVAVHTALNEHDEANFIADAILDGVSKTNKYSDFSVLYRKNSQSNIIEKTFIKSAIPYRIIGGLRFYERKEIRDMIAYLSVVNNPSDEIRIRRVVNQPKRSIGERTITTASEVAFSENKPLIDVMRSAEDYSSLSRSATKLKGFANLIDDLIEISMDENTSIHDLYRSILEKTDYISSLDDDKEDRIDNINELASNIMKYEEDNGEDATLSGFLEEVSLLTDIDNYNGDADAVIMMTMHSAKGLEFPVVFLPGFEEGIFPGIQVLYNEKEIEEERRLAYVAMTRAKEALYILNANSRMLFGNTSRNKLSRFASEIPGELVIRTKARDWEKPDTEMVMPKSSQEARLKSTSSARLFGQPTINSNKPSQVFSTGERVSHKIFGIGKIISSTKMGNDSLLEVDFEKSGSKKIMANFARLTKV